MQIHNIKQNTDEWHAVRSGKITGSGVGEIMKSGRGNKFFGDAAMKYIMTKVSERMTGEIRQSGSTASTRWGHDHENEAKERYEYETMRQVYSIGFVEVDEYTGCSPDGILDDRIIEIKCPYDTVNHLNTLLTGEVPKQYISQVQFNMWCCGRKKCDFISYDPRIEDEEKQIKIIEVEIDEEYISNMLYRMDEAVSIMLEVESEFHY